jgi:isoleucyl-tRNA synthetase
VTLCHVAAPLLPLVAEHVHHGLTGEPAADSVHLTDWPDPDRFPFDPDLHAGMDQVRDACSTLLSLRKAEGLRVRLPLSRAVVAAPNVALLEPHIAILRDELNVKHVELTTDVDRFGDRRLVLNPKALGPRLGGRTQEVIRAHKAGDWTVDGERAIVGGIVLEPGEFAFELVSAGEGAVSTLRSSDGLVVLDTTVTAELEREGAARDLVRQIQQARREAGLDVSDRVALTITGPASVIEAFEAHRELVMSETLAIAAEAGTSDEDVSISVRAAR